MRRLLPLLLSVAALAGAEPLPPSPSDHPGLPLVPAPGITHWPAIVYTDETRSVAFTVSGPGGAPGRFAWDGGADAPFRLPAAGGRRGGLAPLPRTPGVQRGVIEVDGRATPVALRLADAAGPWPLAGLRDGRPVDGDGLPVVLLDRRRDGDQERRLALLRREAPRGEDPPLVLGDPLAGPGGDAWARLPTAAVRRPVADLVRPHHGVLAALAAALNPVPAGGAGLRPATILWCPGNGEVAAGDEDGEEERLLGALRSRCEGLELRPRLILALPPLPVDDRSAAEARRERLRQAAGQLGWVVVDLARAAGDPAEGNRLGAGVFADHPVAQARERMARVLAEALER